LEAGLISHASPSLGAGRDNERFSTSHSQLKPVGARRTRRTSPSILGRDCAPTISSGRPAGPKPPNASFGSLSVIRIFRCRGPPARVSILLAFRRVRPKPKQQDQATSVRRSIKIPPPRWPVGDEWVLYPAPLPVGLLGITLPLFARGCCTPL